MLFDHDSATDPRCVLTPTSQLSSSPDAGTDEHLTSPKHTGTSASSTSSQGTRLRVCLVSPKDHPAIIPRPEPDQLPVDFVIGNSLEDFSGVDLAECEALFFQTLGGNVDTLGAVFERSPKVKWVHSFFAGVDVLAPFIRNHLTTGRGMDVVLTNGRGAFSESLAEWVMTSVLYFNKQIVRCQSNRAERKWDKFVMDTVARKTIGVVGFGSIGQLCAKYAKGFGMRVVALRRSNITDGGADQVFTRAERAEMFGQCDYIVSALPGTPDTTDFFDATAFAEMKPGAVFISVGRGVVVDEDALNEVLKSGHLKGAALDVYKKEPLPSESPLWDRKNLLHSAHNADYTAEYFDLAWQTWVENYEAFRAGTPLCTPVDKEKGY